MNIFLAGGRRQRKRAIVEGFADENLKFNAKAGNGG